MLQRYQGYPFHPEELMIGDKPTASERKWVTYVMRLFSLPAATLLRLTYVTGRDYSLGIFGGPSVSVGTRPCRGE